MALNISDAISQSLILVAQLVKDVSAAKAQAGASASLATEAIDLVEIAVADPAVQASLKALIAAL